MESHTRKKLRSWGVSELLWGWDKPAGKAAWMATVNRTILVENGADGAYVDCKRDSSSLQRNQWGLYSQAQRRLEIDQ